MVSDVIVSVAPLQDTFVDDRRFERNRIRQISLTDERFMSTMTIVLNWSQAVVIKSCIILLWEV